MRKVLCVSCGYSRKNSRGCTARKWRLSKMLLGWDCTDLVSANSKDNKTNATNSFNQASNHIVEKVMFGNSHFSLNNKWHQNYITSDIIGTWPLCQNKNRELFHSNFLIEVHPKCSGLCTIHVYEGFVWMKQTGRIAARCTRRRNG